MLEIWNSVVFMEIAERLLSVAMNLVERERNGESVDTKLIAGIRESFGKLALFSKCTPFSGSKYGPRKPSIALRDAFRKALLRVDRAIL